MDAGVPDARAVPAHRTRCTRRSTGCGCCRGSRSALPDLRRSSRSRSPTWRCSSRGSRSSAGYGRLGGLPFGAFEIAVAGATRDPGVVRRRVGPAAARRLLASSSRAALEPSPPRAPRAEAARVNDAVAEQPRAARRAASVRSSVFLGVRIGLFVLAAIAVGVIPPRDGRRRARVARAPARPGWHNAFTGHRAPGRAVVPADRDDRATRRRRQRGVLPPVSARGPGGVVARSAASRSRPRLLVSNAAFFGALVVLYDLTRPRVRPRRSRGGRSSTWRSSPRRSSSWRRTASRCSCCCRCSRSGWRGAIDGRRPRSPGALAALTRSIGIVLAPALADRGVRAVPRRTAGRLAARWPRGARRRCSGRSLYLGVVGRRARRRAARRSTPRRTGSGTPRSRWLTLWRATRMALGSSAHVDPATGSSTCSSSAW